TLGIHTDSPDHIGTIRRMLATGDPFPRDAFFKDAGATGADPRKGFWHPQVALIARLAGADPVDTWRLLPACTAPIAVLSASSLGLLAGGPAAAATTAWAHLLLYSGSLARLGLRETAFATKLEDHLVLTAVVAVLADLEAPALAGRGIAALLALGAVTTHLFGAFQLALVLCAMLIVGLVRRSPCDGTH